MPQGIYQIHNQYYFNSQIIRHLVMTYEEAINKEKRETKKKKKVSGYIFIDGYGGVGFVRNKDCSIAHYALLHSV